MTINLGGWITRLKTGSLSFGELVIDFTHREISARNDFQAQPTERYYKRTGYLTRGS